MPLNGTKTHPLSEHSRIVLVRLLQGAIPTQEINPGVVNRLTHGKPWEQLAWIVTRPSPYKTHRGRPIAHLEITDAGKAYLHGVAALKRSVSRKKSHSANG